MFIFTPGDALLVNPWRDGSMPKRSNPKRDFMEVARGIVEQAIGEQMGGSPLPEPDTRNRTPWPAEVLAGKGGRSRAKRLSPAKR